MWPMVPDRRVVSIPSAVQFQAAGGPAPALDTYISRLVKYIPAEIVAAYLLVRGFIPPDAPRWIWWIVFAGLMGLTVWYTLDATRRPGLPPAYTQSVIAVLAFAVWTFAIGGPYFEVASWYRQYHYLPGIILVLFTLAVARIPPLEK